MCLRCFGAGVPVRMVRWMDWIMRPLFLGRSRNEATRVGITPSIHKVIAAAIFCVWLAAIAAGVLAWLK